MPIIKSAIKRMRQTEKRRARNVTAKRDLRQALKNFFASKSTDDLRKAQSELDTAVKKNIMTKNTAARKKSQLVKQAKDAGAKPAAAAKKPVAKAKATTAKTSPATKPATAKKPAAKKVATKKAE